ncbi:MAG: sulfur carrier protein ThiS [Gammaproteobacteria bacterium]|nr:sulfur carrier protein ThiS [Gammaproteobacteria bacterium]
MSDQTKGAWCREFQRVAEEIWNLVKIILNNEEMSIKVGRTVEALLKQLEMDRSERIAIAVNDQVVSRSDWPNHQLRDNDRVLVIAPIQGG